MIFVPSVMSTGTNFLLGLLGGEAWHLLEILDGKLINGRRPDIATIHLRHKDWQESEFILPTVKAFAMGHRTIIPMRDPALSVITALQSQKYDPMLRLFGFDDVHELTTLTQVEFLPVDLPGIRDQALQAILPGAKTDWKPTNSLGDYRLKLMYQNDIASAIPQELWEALRRREGRLRPMLERIGYRDLLWWSK